jgi:hypothetical protein
VTVPPSLRHASPAPSLASGNRASPSRRRVMHVVGLAGITGIGLLKIARQLGIYSMQLIDYLVRKKHIRQSIDK